MVLGASASQQIGLQAIMDMSQFDNSMNRYMSSIGAATGATETAATAMGTSLSAGAAAAAVAVGMLAFTIVTKLITALKDLTAEGIMGAARVQELSYVLQIMAGNAGYTKEQIDEQVKGIIEMGIRTDEAQRAVIQFMQSELDLAKASELARVAQDAAVIGAIDSSEAYNRIVYGISRYNTEILRTIGLNIRAEDAMETYAATLKKSASDLTVAEKSQAFLNAVLQEGTKIAGAYEAAMEAPGKQLRSLSRDVFELTRVMGEPFLAAFSSVVTTMRDMVKAFRAALDEGGPLREFMINLGAAASIAADAIQWFVTNSANALINFLSILVNGTNSAGAQFEGIANDAMAWGYNIINSLATGIIQGVVAVLNALAYVGNIIAGMLEALSPPRLLPDLDKWGAAAMTVYMEGWKNADFSAFNEIAGIVTNFLRSLSEKVISEKGLIPQILGAREAIAKAIEQVREMGTVTDAMLSNLIKKLGPVTAEFKEYIKNTLQMVLVEKQLADAQKALAVVTEFYDKKLEAQGSERAVSLGQ